MSTAGKVLVVLVLLMVPVWIVLISGLAQFNRTGTAAFEKAQKEYADVMVKLAETEQNVAALRDQIGLAQDAMDRDLTVISAHQVDIEKARSEVLETGMRVKFQLDDVKATLANAEKSRDTRIAEKKAEIEALAVAREDVEKLKGENTALMVNLVKLRDEFKSLLESNQDLVNRLNKAGNRPTRSASFVP